MIKVHFVPASGAGETTLQVKPGQSLMQAAVANDLDGIAADCGGMLTCATCHVYVREPASARRPNSRLSCQVRLTQELDGLTVDLPPSQY